MEIRKDTIVGLCGLNYSDAGMRYCFYSAYTTAEHIELAWDEMDRLCEDGKLWASHLEGGAVYAIDENGEEIALSHDDYKDLLLPKDAVKNPGEKYLYEEKEDIPKEWFYPEAE